MASLGMLRRALHGLVLVALSSAALGFAAWALPLSQYRPRASTIARSDAVAVTERANDLASPATVSLQWSRQRTLFVSGGGGLVTRVFVNPGRMLQCGAEVIEVDGVAKRAYCAIRPMWQQIDASSVGVAAEEFAVFLRSIGFLGDVDGSPAGAELAAGIRKWQTASSQPVTGIVAPDDVIWIGSGPVTPTSVTVGAGEALGERGAVALVAPELVSASVNDTALKMDNSQRVVGVDGSAIQVSVSANGTIADLDSLMSALEEAGAIADTPPQTMAGLTRLAAPRMLATVPATSVVSGPSGVCVRIVRSSGSPVAVSVQPVGASTGVIFVSGEVQAGDLVVVNPDRSAGC